MDYTTEFFLIFRRRRNRIHGLSVRLSERAPVLKPGEIAVWTSVRLPGAVFERPQLTAAIAIPSAEIPSRPIPAQVQENIAEALRRQLGAGVTLQIEAKP